MGALRTFLCMMLCGICAAFSILLIHAPVFGGGEGYELYAGTSSGPIILTGDPLAEKLRMGQVEGESARFEGDRAEEFMEMFRAKMVFSEEVCGVTNYYLYSPMLGGGVLLNGRRVNLHIAVRGERTAVGTPLIFGGI